MWDMKCRYHTMGEYGIEIYYIGINGIDVVFIYGLIKKRVDFIWDLNLNEINFKR